MRLKLVAFLVVAMSLLCVSANARNASRTLLSKTVSAEETARFSETYLVPDGANYLAAEAKFVYAAGGTTFKAWIQTSLDGGVTWIDVMSFAFATTTASKVSAVVSTTALAAGATPSDGALADNTILSGLIGDRIRVKWTSTGVYSGATTIVIVAVTR